MQARIMAWFRARYDKWKSLAIKQKGQIIALVAIIIIGIIITAYLALRPKMDVLYTFSSAQEAARLRSSLSSGGIASEIGGNGTQVLVNHKSYYDALAYVEENSLISDPEFTYQNAIDFSTIGTAETITAENFRKAAQTDIAKIIKKFKGVTDCSVSLVVPGTSNFWLPEQQEASASVTVTTSTKFDSTQGEAIARLVARSVKNLKPENIEVMDTDWNVLFSGLSKVDGNIANRADAETIMSERLESQIKKALRPRYDQVIMLANLAFDWDKLTQESVEYNVPNNLEGNTGLVDHSQTTNSSYSGTTNEGEPGPGSNDLTSPTYNQGTGDTSTQTSKTNDTNYLYNIVNTVKDSQLGKFLKDSSSLSVYLYKYEIFDEADLQARGLLNDMTWAEFKVANAAQTPLDIDQSTVDSLKTGTGIGSISVIGMTIPQFVDKVIPPVRIAEFVSYGIVILLILLLAYALLKRTQPDEITEIEPTLTVEEMLVSTKQDEIEKAEAEALKEIEFGVESEVRKQINKFVQEKPEAVAQLLRNWLSENWE